MIDYKKQNQWLKCLLKILNYFTQMQVRRRTVKVKLLISLTKNLRPMFLKKFLICFKMLFFRTFFSSCFQWNVRGADKKVFLSIVCLVIKVHLRLNVYHQLLLVWWDITFFLNLETYTSWSHYASVFLYLS